MKYFYALSLGVCFLFSAAQVKAQDMLDELGDDDTVVERVTNSFKNTKVINAQSLPASLRVILRSPVVCPSTNPSKMPLTNPPLDDRAMSALRTDRSGPVTTKSTLGAPLTGCK